MREDREAVRRHRPVALAGVLIVVTGLTAACTGSTEKAETTPSPTTTPLAEVDLTGVTVSRSPSFCESLDPGAVGEVLGGEPENTTAYASGQRAEVTTEVRDVANEHSCYFDRGTGETLRTARTWLFAQAVTREEARRWVEERSKDEACREAGELAYGDPGLVQSCASGDRRRVTAVGLFGDAWLTCQTTASVGTEEKELLEQTQRWCAAVAQSAAVS
jgi:hypothetical protein